MVDSKSPKICTWKWEAGRFRLQSHAHLLQCLDTAVVVQQAEAGRRKRKRLRTRTLRKIPNYHAIRHACILNRAYSIVWSILYYQIRRTWRDSSVVGRWSWCVPLYPSRQRMQPLTQVLVSRCSCKLCMIYEYVCTRYAWITFANEFLRHTHTHTYTHTHTRIYIYSLTRTRIYTYILERTVYYLFIYFFIYWICKVYT